MSGEAAVLRQEPVGEPTDPPVADQPDKVDIAKLIADTHPLRQSFNRLDPNQGSMVNDWHSSYSKMWGEDPLKAGIITAGTAMIGTAMWAKLPRVTAYGAAAIGATKLVLSDGHDLLTARNGQDVLKYGAETVSDLAMIGGVATRYIPQLKKASMAITAVGVLGRIGAGFLPDSNDFSTEKVTAPPSQRVTVDVPLGAGKTEQREFDLFIPKTVDPNQKMPLMLVMHGVADGHAAGSMEKETLMNRLAEEKGFAVAYPVAKPFEHPQLGTMQDWNSPGAGLTAPRAGYDDVDYIKALMAKVGTMANLDTNALYATGFSSGGEFAQHLRGRMPGTFAGIASVHGTLLGTEARPVTGDQTAFLSIHSDSDNMLPYGGGRGIMTSILPRVADSKPQSQIPMALQGNGLTDSQPLRTTFKNVEVTEYVPQPGQAPVKEYVIKGGMTGGMLGAIFGRGRDGFPANHAWDGPGAGGWPVVGEKNHSLDVSRLVVEELLKYKRPGAPVVIERDLK